MFYGCRDETDSPVPIQELTKLEGSHTIDRLLLALSGPKHEHVQDIILRERVAVQGQIVAGGATVIVCAMSEAEKAVRTALAEVLGGNSTVDEMKSKGRYISESWN